MKFDGYYHRALKAADRRYRQAFERMGYGRRDMRAVEPVYDGYPDDATLRAAIEAATGEKLHHRTGRTKLIEAYEAALAAAIETEATSGEDG